MAIHDYVIANGTGAAVRGDLNDALAAIVSQNSSATAPTTTYAYMLWADTTAGILKQRNGANNAWIDLIRLDGAFDSKTFNGNVTLNAQGDVRFADSDSSNWVAFQAPATIASNITWTLPATDGTADQAFATNGSGILSWVSFLKSSGGALTGDLTLNAQSDLRFADADSSNWVAFQAPATVASNVTWTLPATDGTNGQSLQTNGSGTLSWATAGGSATRTTFTSSGTWTKPGSGTVVRVTLWGGGGGGGTGAPGAGGGGGGACVFRWFSLSELPSTVSVTIGAGGAAGNPGTTGGTSSFGSLFSAYGGSGGTQSVAGAGGGALSAGSGTTGGTGYGAINTGAAAGASADCSGGGGANGGTVGKSTFGGGGGGSSGTAGGVSLSGGAGGTGWVSGVGGTAGTVPAGGGGSGWPGAAGLCYIDVW